MEKILLSVDYTDNTGKFWQESYIKNKIVAIDGDIKKTIVKTIEDVDNMHVSYNGKPQGNVYRDKKDGSSVRVGYIYRVQSDIYDEGKTHKALFDAWVTVHGIVPVDIEDIDGI